MVNKIQLRRDTAANWTAANPILASGEKGYETDTKLQKIGDGTTAWTSLGYLASPQVVLDGAYAPIAKGMIAFVWDDGFATHDTVAALANARGQKHTFAVVSNFMTSGNPTYATSAQVLAWSQAGHEIASHSVDHSSMTSLTAANRVLQYENSRTAIEAVIGAGKIKSFVYPLGGTNRSATTDKELYLRYDRAVDTGPYYPIRSDDATRTGDFLTKRFTWNETDNSNQELLDRIKQCANEPIILITTGHNLGDAGAPTLAQVTAALDLAKSLGIPCVTLSQAMPPSQRLINPGFEEFSGTAPSLPVGWGKNVSDAGQTVESIADTPDTGLAGTRSLHLQSTADTATFAYARQAVHLVPNSLYQVTGRYRTAKTGAGTGGLYIRVQEYGYDQLASIAATDQTLLAESAGWTTFALTFTSNSNARFGYLDFLYQNQTGQAWIDHVDIRQSRFGSFGN